MDVQRDRLQDRPSYVWLQSAGEQIGSSGYPRPQLVLLYLKEESCYRTSQNLTVVFLLLANCKSRAISERHSGFEEVFGTDISKYCLFRCRLDSLDYWHKKI